MPAVSPTDAVPPGRICIVYRSGRSSELAWSRIPAGLARGLAQLGLAPELVDAEPRKSVMRLAKAWAAVVRGSRHGGLHAREIRSLRRLTARLRAPTLRPVDAVIQMGSDFGLPFEGRLVTYEDTTVLQRDRLDDLRALLGAGAVLRWIAEQRRCYAAAVACCAMSQWAADSIVDDYGVDPNRVHVVWAGRNCEPRPVDRDWSRPRFLFMGNDWERKNGARVVEAFARLKEHVPNARLDVAGAHPPIDVDGVVNHGPLDFSVASERAQAEALFESATCFVMPSRFEPFGMVYVEAAAAGVPSVGTTVGGARDAIGDAGGLLVEPSDERGLLGAMTAMCDGARASAMGAAALERSDLFTWRAVAERIVRAFQDGAAASSQRHEPIGQTR